MPAGTNKRTHCDCGTELEHPGSVGGNWGDWKCRNPKCWFRFCQDCGAHLDQNNECVSYRDAQDSQYQDQPEGAN